jgi:hypothetical protein
MADSATYYKTMKPKRNQCPLAPPQSKGNCPLKSTQGEAQQPPVVVMRTERRSWFTLAITAFGAVLLRYLKTVRERGWKTRKAANPKRRCG